MWPLALRRVTSLMKVRGWVASWVPSCKILNWLSSMITVTTLPRWTWPRWIFAPAAIRAPWLKTTRVTRRAAVAGAGRVRRGGLPAGGCGGGWGERAGQGAGQHAAGGDDVDELGIDAQRDALTGQV